MAKNVKALLSILGVSLLLSGSSWAGETCVGQKLYIENKSGGSITIAEVNKEKGEFYGPAKGTVIPDGGKVEWRVQKLNNLNRADINIWVDTVERSVKSAEVMATFTGVQSCMVTLRNNNGETLTVDQDVSQHTFAVELNSKD